MNDARLLAAGHPSGSDFRLSERVAEIKHWPDSSDMAAARLQSAQDAIVAERGPVPAVTVTAPAARAGAVPPSPATPTPAGPAGSLPAAGNPAPTAGPVSAPVSGAGSQATATAAPRAPVTDGVPTPAPGAGPAAGPVDPIGPQSPVVTQESSVDELLLQIKRRLEELYARLRGSSGG